MNISCTLDGASVNVVDVDMNGSEAVVTYIDASGNLVVKKKYAGNRESLIIATDAVIN